jgi:hypothetical protein
MKPLTLLKKVGINFDEPVLLITAEESIENLLETIEEYCPNLKINKMTKKDIKTLLDSYGNCVINYHPEKYHQERATLLKNFEMLRRYGLTDDDYRYIDFC